VACFLLSELIVLRLISGTFRSLQVRIRVETLLEKELVVMKRALLLLRRATAAFYFTSSQVEQLLNLIATPVRTERTRVRLLRYDNVTAHQKKDRSYAKTGSGQT
jgi:hypothetical protein